MTARQSRIDPFHDMVGKVPDVEICRLTGVSSAAVRARVPEVTAAKTNEERLRIYWGALESKPEAVEQAEALRLLSELDATP